jgi:hypothetical protein
MLVNLGGQSLVVNVADGNQVSVPGRLIGIAVPFAANADLRNVDSLVGRLFL